MNRYAFIALLVSAVKLYTETPNQLSSNREKAKNVVRSIMPFALENNEELVEPIADVIGILSKHRHDALVTNEFVEKAVHLYQNSMVGQIDHQPA